MRLILHLLLQYITKRHILTYFCPHIEVEQRPRYRRASNPTLEVIQRQKCSKITIFYYFAKARVKARSSTSKARSSNTKIEPRLGLGSSSKMKSSNSSKLDNFRLVAPLVFTAIFENRKRRLGYIKVCHISKAFLQNKNI